LTETAARHRLSASAIFPLLPILLLAAAVRLLGLGNDNLWSDEAFSVITALGPPSQLLRILAATEPHPPLYPFFLAGWLRLFGSSELIARLPSAFAGIASVAVAAAIARSFVPEEDRRPATLAALVAGLFVALNPFQVWYSQEARMYAQVSFFAGLATLALLRMREGRRGSLPLYVGALVAAAGSHYYGLFLPVAHGVVVLASAQRDRRLLRPWLTAIVAAVLLYLPWTFLALRVFTSYYGGPPGSEDLARLALSAWVRVTAGWSLTWDQAVLLAGLVSALAVFGVVVPARGERDRFVRAVLLAWLVTPFVAGYLVSLVRPLFNERYLIVSSLPFVLLLARGSVWLLTFGRPTRPVRPLRTIGLWVARAGGVLTVLVVLGAADIALQNVWRGDYVKSAYNTHVKTVDRLARAGDAVILDGRMQEQLYEYYARPPLPFFTLPEQTPADPVATSATLDQIARAHPGVWVFWYASDLDDPRNEVGRWLLANAYLSFDTYAGNTRLQYYRFAPQLAAAVRPTAISFGQAAVLDGYSWTDESLPSGGTIPIDLRWHAPGATSNKLRVALRLVDDAGFTWVQSDQDVSAPFDLVRGLGTADDHHGLLVPVGTPPGAYSLMLNAYLADDAKSLPLAGTGAPLTPGGVKLGAVRITAPSKVAWPEGIAGFQATPASFPGGLALLGYAGSRVVPAGQSGSLTLLWQTTRAGPASPHLRLELRTANDQVVETRDVSLATSSYPLSQWQAGDVLREQYRLPVDDKLPTGDYRLAVLPFGDAAPPPGAPAPGAVVLGPLHVEAAAPVASPSPPARPLAYVLGQVIGLQGYDLASDKLRPGDTLNLTLHWSDLAPVDGDYTVFVHILDASDKIIAQRDQSPANGLRPTSSWFPGDTILDQYAIPLPPGLALGDYAVEIGLYNPTDGQRLPVAHDGAPAGDRIIVTHLQVGE
jgi:mannosyltransferase